MQYMIMNVPPSQQHFRPKYSLECLPGFGSLSPSKARVVGAETSCLTPGLRLSRANGQSSPSVDSISIVGTGGKVFSSPGIQTEVKSQKTFGQRNTVKDNRFTMISQNIPNTQLQSDSLSHKHTESISEESL